MPKNNEKFKIKFRGTRGSYPVAKKGFLEFGGNTACVEVRCNKQLILLDAGGGIIDVGLDELKKIPRFSFKPHFTTIILSHIHQDHIQGLQFYKPLFTKKSKIKLFGPALKEESLEETLRKILFDKVFPLNLDEIRSDFEVNNLSEDIAIVITQGGNIKTYSKIDLAKKSIKDDIVITAYNSKSHPKNGCLCVKIQYNQKVLVYATDIETGFNPDTEFLKFIKDCDLLIHDAQYTSSDYNNPKNPKKGFGHSTFEMAVDTQRKTGAKQLYFFHYDPEYDDNKLFNLEKIFANKNVHFAKENDEIII